MGASTYASAPPHFTPTYKPIAFRPLSQVTTLGANLLERKESPQKLCHIRKLHHRS